MKKGTVILFIMSILLLCSCRGSNMDVFDLPGNPTGFKMSSYNNPDKPGDVYDAIQYDDRVYIPYGSVNNDQMDGRDIDKCLGYIVRDSEEDKELRVYTLSEDMENNYVMIYDVEKDISQAMFWRSVDTRTRKIETPGYIDATHYNYWE